jgi:hypothetical protein
MLFRNEHEEKENEHEQKVDGHREREDVPKETEDGHKDKEERSICSSDVALPPCLLLLSCVVIAKPAGGSPSLYYIHSSIFLSNYLFHLSIYSTNYCIIVSN